MAVDRTIFPSAALPFDLREFNRNVQGRRMLWYPAFVVDNKDPQRAGRLKLRVPHLFHNEETDWCYGGNYPSGGKHNIGVDDIPEVGAKVWAVCVLGDPSNILWTGSWKATGRQAGKPSLGIPVPEDTRPFLSQARTRAQWGAANPVRPYDSMGQVTRITVHRSETPDDDPIDPASRWRSIQDYHLSLDWTDIGYHYGIDRDGRLWTLRPVSAQGAHAGSGNNEGNIGVVLLGSDRFSSAQLESAIRLMDDLVARHGLEGTEIFGHRDLVSTDCPGPLYEDLVSPYRNGAIARPWRSDEPPARFNVLTSTTIEEGVPSSLAEGPRPKSAGTPPDPSSKIPELCSLTRGGGKDPKAVPWMPPPFPDPSTQPPKGTALVQTCEPNPAWPKMLQPASEVYQERESPYATEYPWNKVRRTRHTVVEFDDSPNAPRFHVWFRPKRPTQAPSEGQRSPLPFYLEVGPDGQAVLHYGADRMEITRGGVREVIEGNYDLEVKGNFRVRVNGEIQMLSHGDRYDTVNGNWNRHTTGDDYAEVRGGTIRNLIGAVGWQMWNTHLWNIVGVATWTKLSSHIWLTFGPGIWFHGGGHDWAILNQIVWAFTGVFTWAMTGAVGWVFSGLTAITSLLTLGLITPLGAAVTNAAPWAFTGDLVCLNATAANRMTAPDGCFGDCD